MDVYGLAQGVIASLVAWAILFAIIFLLKQLFEEIAEFERSPTIRTVVGACDRRFIERRKRNEETASCDGWNFGNGPFDG